MAQAKQNNQSTKITGIPFIDNLINGAENVANTAGKDVSSGVNALMNYINQPKAHTKTNGAISSNPVVQQVTQPIQQRIIQTGQNFASSPIGQLLSGNYSNVIPTAESDIKNTAHQVASGNMSPFMGMLGVDAPMDIGSAEQLPSDVLNTSEANIPYFSKAAQDAEYKRTGNPNAYPKGSPDYVDAVTKQYKAAGGKINSQPEQGGFWNSPLGKFLPWISAPAIYGVEQGVAHSASQIPSLMDYLGHQNIQNIFNSKPLQTANTQTTADNKSISTYKPYSAPDLYGSNQGFLSPSEYTSQRNALTQKMGSEALTNPLQYKQDQAKQAALDQTYATQEPIRNAYQNGTNGVVDITSYANDVLNQLPKVKLDFFNILDKGYNVLEKSTDKNYAGLGYTLDYLSRQTGIDFTSANTPDALKGKLDQAITIVNQKFANTLKTGYGGQNPNNQTNQPVNQPVAPVSQAPAPSTPANFHMGDIQ